MTEKIDFVILWVDGNDKDWKRQRSLFLPEEADNGWGENRFRDWGLMRYWFRGVERFAPWVNRIFFVTNGQIPRWLNSSHPKLRLIKHEDYIPKKYLPTFNSNVIELWLHNIQELEEKFVLFNDDMFLTAPVEPEDFFREGLPCDSALMDIAAAPGPEDCLPHMQINNFALINAHFNKKKVIQRNMRKFFSFRYRADIIRNLLLFPFQQFSCFRDSHLPSSHLKSTFIQVWEKEGTLLKQCGSHRYRSKADLTHWLMKAWQICEGKFAVRGTNWGHHFELWEDDIDLICRSIERQKYHAVCLNDSKTDVEFEKLSSRLKASFESILPEPSAFEKYSERSER